MEKRRLIKQYKNGNKVWGVTVKCEKCGGTGVIPQFYHIASGTCFDCNGTGKVEEKEYEYTPGWIAKQEAKRAKEAEKRAAEEAEREAERARREAEWKAQEAERERIRRGHFYGEVGQKIEMEVTYTGHSEFETVFGWTTVYRFDTDDGAHLVWKTGAELGGTDWFIDEGDRITIKATIKDHKEYRGIEQTELTRLKVVKAVHKIRELTREELIEAEENQRKMTDEEYDQWRKEVWAREPKEAQ